MFCRFLAGARTRLASADISNAWNFRIPHKCLSRGFQFIKRILYVYFHVVCEQIMFVTGLNWSLSIVTRHKYTEQYGPLIKGES